MVRLYCGKLKSCQLKLVEPHLMMSLQSVSRTLAKMSLVRLQLLVHGVPGNFFFLIIFFEFFLINKF